MGGPSWVSRAQGAHKVRGALSQRERGRPKSGLTLREWEIICVYGRTMKEIIKEKFGAGIMNAIDFTVDIEKVPDSNDDRVKVTHTGKFLFYKRW
jgi:cyanate lyase